jgi:ketosteroid isomerase-like protein
MRHLILCAALSVAVAAPARAQAPDPQMMAPINKFLDAFNKGDMAAAASTHAADADLVILDEVPPFLWRGAQAFKTWAADLEADGKKRGETDQKVTLSAPTRTETSGSAAYVVVPAVYTFKRGGVAMRENAQMTFALVKNASGWLIHGWTWTGPKAAGAAAK